MDRSECLHRYFFHVSYVSTFLAIKYLENKGVETNVEQAVNQHNSHSVQGRLTESAVSERPKDGSDQRPAGSFGTAP